ncbi:MAG: hemerythrin domain-containing protein [Saprospiraceae bacterium]|nr:hemerythrin domain-containing protein [Saprospiraceae bacterium]
MRKPIKRHIRLQPLSREHHQGLLLSWKIREGFRRKLEPQRIKRYVNWFWEQHLLPHFTQEEEVLFPLLSADHEHIQKALSDHRHLKQLVEQEKDIVVTLNQIADDLENHIRFEERILFNVIQEATPEEYLEVLDLHETGDAVCEQWQDEFWV